jgi:hypothetical protein
MFYVLNEPQIASESLVLNPWRLSTAIAGFEIFNVTDVRKPRPSGLWATKPIPSSQTVASARPASPKALARERLMA